MQKVLGEELIAKNGETPTRKKTRSNSEAERKKLEPTPNTCVAHGPRAYYATIIFAEKVTCIRQNLQKKGLR